MKKESGTVVDDLLDDQTTQNGETAQTTAVDKRSKEEIEKEIKDTQDKIKALRAEMKGEKIKAPRVLKGKMVAFKNKAGETIYGLGQLYYVARHKGKLHYKEASQVVELAPDWKEGDALPPLPGDEDGIAG